MTAEYDVPLMVSRGFASESYLYSAAAAIDARSITATSATGAMTLIYYFGDHDPSGLKIDAAIETGIRRILVDEFNWPTDATTSRSTSSASRSRPGRSQSWSLPTRPTKIKGNEHAKDWDEDEESVELDAIPAGDATRARARRDRASTSTRTSSSACAIEEDGARAAGPVRAGTRPVNATLAGDDAGTMGGTDE